MSAAPRLRPATIAVVVVAATLFASVLSASASGAPAPATGAGARAAAVPDAAAVAPGGTERQLARLEKQAAALSKEYRGELIHLDEARKAAAQAAGTALRMQRELADARADVRSIAVSSYMSSMNGGMESLATVVGDDPQGAIRDAALAEHLAWRDGLRVQGLQTLTIEAARARTSAQDKIAQARGVVADLVRRRAKVRVLLAKYRPQAPAKVAPDGGGRSGRSPLTGNYMTARMRALYLAVDAKFGTFPSIGCYRPGDPQDHGTGRACDFMESTGGRMPSAGAQAHGDRVAEFAISNASRYGVKYVIWRQRIYDLRSPGWRAMADRGGITANHYDHVHISVF